MYIFRFVCLLLGISSLNMISIHVLSQNSAFQIGINEHFILDADNSGDSLIYVLTGRVERAPDNTLSFIGGFGAVNPEGNIAKSFRMRASSGFDIQFFGNKVFCNSDGTFYLVLHISRNGVSNGNVLVVLDRDFNIIRTINNQSLGQNLNSFFRVEDLVTNKRFVWLSVFKPAIRSNVLLLLEHDLNTNEFNYKDYQNTNSAFNMIVQDAVAIDSDSYLICGEAIDNVVQRYSLTKFNTETKENKIYTFNFDPIHMTTDPNKNLVIMGSTSDGEIVISKYTNDLDLIWSRKVGFSSRRSDYTFSNRSITTDASGNIFINLRESIEELNLGTKILQIDTNGELVYHKLLLDATQKDVKAIRVFGDNLTLLTEANNNTYLRKMPKDIMTDDIKTINVCTDIEDFAAEIFETNYNFGFLSQVPTRQDLNVTIVADRWTTFPYSEPFDGPFSDFEVSPRQFCLGDKISFDHSSIYPFGISEWSVINTLDTSMQVTKFPIDVVLTREELHYVQHKLFFAGCEYVDTLQIQLKVSDVDFLPEADTICGMDVKTLSLPENAVSRVLWSNGTSSNNIQIANEGIYSVTYTDSIGCSKTENINIKQLFLPEVDLGEDIILCQDSVLILNIPNPYEANITWSDGSQRPEKNIRGSGIFSVTLSNQCGEASDSFEVKAKDCSPVFHYSNVFVPGSDGPNSNFVILGDNLSNVKLQFFDRWGNLVYNKENLDVTNISWDGRFNGQLLSSGVYLFVMSYTETFSGVSKTLLGNTTILR